MLPHDVEEAKDANDILANLSRLHSMATGSESERKFHRERVKNATHHVAIRDGDEWLFAPVKWCGAKDNSIERYPNQKRPVTDKFKPVIIGAGFHPLYSPDPGYEELYASYVNYCDQYGFTHSETEDDRTFYVRGVIGAADGLSRPNGSAVLVNLSNLTDAEGCYVTRVWGFSPASWGALGFPKEGTARRLAEKGRGYFVVCFVSHNKALHITDGDEGLVHGVYELTHDIVNLQDDDVLASSHFDDPNHYIEGRFRWPIGLRAIRAWCFLNPPMTKASLPVARSRSWDVSTGIVPIARSDFELLDQYKLEQVPVFGQPFEKQRLAGPVAIPCHVYLFTCENDQLLQRMPRWRKGEILVKIGCTSDVRGRLASFNDDPLSRLFDFRLAHMTSDLVGEVNARGRETELLSEVAEIGRPATDRTSEFFFIERRQLASLIAKFGKVKRVA